MKSVTGVHALYLEWKMDAGVSADIKEIQFVNGGVVSEKL